MEAFRQLTSLFMSPECFEKIFFELDLLNVPCLKMIVSRGLGYGILLGSMFLRVPQILKLLSAKSGKGISVVSEILALVAIFGTLAYGYLKRFPMAAYGDMYFLYLQGIIILLMVLFYEKKTCSIVISAGTFAAGSSAPTTAFLAGSCFTYNFGAWMRMPRPPVAVPHS